MKNLFIFSSPFCYGPTAKAVSLIEELKKLEQVSITYVGDSVGNELIESLRIPLVRLNQLDVQSIRLFLLAQDNPFVISVMNAFSLEAAKSLGIPSAAIDSLPWFWRDVPESFLRADIYFALNFPGVTSRLGSHKNVRVVPHFSRKLNEVTQKKNSRTIINLGGLKNPIDKKVPYDYLELLIAALKNAMDSLGGVLVCGSREPVKFLSNSLKDSPIQFEALPHDRFQSELSSAKHLITTPGLTTSMEAFSLGIPTSFLLPTNLSQWTNLRVFTSEGLTEDLLRWENYSSLPEGLDRLDEIKSAGIFPDLARSLLQRPEALQAFISDFHMLLKSPKTFSVRQAQFSSTYGGDGASAITNQLRQSWSLN